MIEWSLLGEDRSLKYAFCAFLCLMLLGWYFLTPSVSIPTGKVTTLAPVQTPTAAPPFQKNGYTLTPVADFIVTARLLSKSIYRFDHESELAPVDYALGWLSMSTPRILEKIDISQTGRTYRWYTDDYPMPREDIESQSANMHLIPATPEIEAQLKAMPENSLVRLTGHLVNITSPQGWHWDTSQTRYDTGDGACEVIYVTGVMRGN